MDTLFIKWLFYLILWSTIWSSSLFSFLISRISYLRFTWTNREKSLLKAISHLDTLLKLTFSVLKIDLTIQKDWNIYKQPNPNHKRIENPDIPFFERFQKHSWPFFIPFYILSLTIRSLTWLVQWSLQPFTPNSNVTNGQVMFFPLRIEDVSK